VIAKDKDVGMRYSAYIEAMRRLATNEPSIKTRAVTTQGLEAGSAARALTNSAFMYKSFPITMLNHYMRPAIHRAVAQGKGWELAAFSAALIGMGYFTLLLKDGLKNRTPRDVFDEDTGIDLTTLRQAALQSGAMSVFDFALKDSSSGDSTKDLAKAVVGPTVGAGIDITSSLLDTVYSDKDKAAAGLREGKDIAKRYLNPTATLWWFKAGWNVMIGDALNEAFEGDAWHRRRRRDEKVMQEQGQDYLFEGKPILEGITQ
jgi:hypothetical protein